MPRSQDSSRSETDHPLAVSVQSGDLAGCELQDECRLWGSGILRLTPRGEESFLGTTILTAAGCERCSNPTITQGNIGVIATEKAVVDTRQEALECLKPAAIQKLVAVVEAFSP